MRAVPEISLPKVVLALISDTFQEARARWLFWGLFGLSTLLIAIFLFVLRIDLVQGAVSFMGIESTSRPLNDIQRFVNVSYAWVSIVLYIWGTFLAIFASAGLIPSVLEAGRISLLLSKPLTRTTLLMGRYLGNILIVALNHSYLICSIWLILGIKTRIWEPRFLLAVPISVFIFAVLLCVVVLIGVVFESAALSVMVSVALMLISTILAQRQIVIRLLDSEWSRQLWLTFYWIVPKVFDLGAAMRQIVEYDRQANWLTPVWSSAVFGIIVLSGAIYIFQKRDF
ncbi:MAG: ABC transporter permease [Acidobacteriaceae bacterium]|nr:ABC transporter permease [Acidobacteriaceae bacterium]MBV9781080.1 ABC transporter permease [Acidobacteriaceae bacterium]